MNINEKILNNIFDESQQFINNSLSKYNYNEEIQKILLLIIPSFIIKYGYENKNKIFKTFNEVSMKITKEEEKIYQAYYVSIPNHTNNIITTTKYIIVHNYKDKKLIELIDNIIHEYNHAINSLINEIKEDENNIYIRTGLTYAIYKKNNLLEGIKEDSYILEEIINTKQTEQIIEIIKSLKQYNIKNENINNMLYNINLYINNKYTSEAYLLQSTLCKELMNNNIFISVLSGYRISGNIDAIEEFFNNITGINNSYKILINLLIKSVKLEEEISKTKFFKTRKINKLKNIYHQAKEIIDTFNYNYHF